MDILFKARPFYLDEQRLLKSLQTQKGKKVVSKIKFYHFILALLAGSGFTYLAAMNKDRFWALPFGIAAIFLFAFIVLGPYELYKMRRKNKISLQRLNTIIAKGTVDTCLIQAKRIAVAKEFEDEGDLFIIEYDTDKILYLWDYDYALRKKFPCLQFEIYEEHFFKLFGRLVYPLSERIQPLTIDKKAKWNYIEKMGVPGHLETQNIEFDQLITNIINSA